MKNVSNWFEIPTHQLDAAQRFYETVLARSMRREQMGPSELAVFPYEAEEGSGGCLWKSGPDHKPGAQGAIVYLDCSPSIDAALSRVADAGGKVALGKQALPPGMGFFAHIVDLEGNKVGLHALA